MYDVVIGRSEEDRKQFGKKGTIFIGKQYVQMGRSTSLSNPIYLDVARSHVVFVCGKRGSGKSYFLGVVAEGLTTMPEEIAQNISIVMLDTMGVYWTMKYPNKADAELLEEWGLEPKGLNVTIYTPTGYFKEYKDKGIPTDFSFSIKPSELDPADWCTTFDINPNDEIGTLIERVIWKLKASGKEFSIKDIMAEIKKDERSEQRTKDAAENHFSSADNWGLFDIKGTEITELVKGGQVTILDMSCYATMPGGWNIKSLALGLISKKLFIQRMVERKDEEFEEIESAVHYFTKEAQKKQKIPMVWLVIDEAHEFLPIKGKTAASEALITILREGRQPGISLILASQQPGKIHTDVMTQADTVVAHRITAKIDADALGNLMQTYMRNDLTTELDNLPRVAGSALVFDDTNERLFSVKIRPRTSWHGGSAPAAVKMEKKIFE